MGKRVSFGMQVLVSYLAIVAFIPQIVVAEPVSGLEGQVSLSGWLTVLVGDPGPGAGLEPVTIYTLTDDDGHQTRLLLNADLIRPLGGTMAINRKRVKVVGVPSNKFAGVASVLSIALDVENIK